MLMEWKCMTAEAFKTIGEKDVAVMAIGSCEQHGVHLPVGTDVYLGEAVIRYAADRSERNIVMLPSLGYGFSAHHMDFPGSITLTQKTLSNLILEIASGVFAAGFTKLVLLVSHGGNSPSVHMAVNELGIQFPEKEVVMLRYWDFMRDFMKSLRSSKLGGIGHAGEMETSMMMAIHPELVGEGWEKYELANGNQWYHPDMFADNKVTVYRRFKEISPYGNVGVCSDATAKKGEEILNYLGKHIGDFLDGYFT